MVVLVFYGVDELDSSFLKEEGTLFLGWDRDDLVSYVSSPGTWHRERTDLKSPSKGPLPLGSGTVDLRRSGYSDCVALGVVQETGVVPTRLFSDWLPVLPLTERSHEQR